jgi:hypothetical protein
MLNKQQIISAMSLDADGITAALRNNDYQDESVLTAEFTGMTRNGSFTYTCTYNDQDLGTEEDCIVYVTYTKQMRMVADY